MTLGVRGRLVVLVLAVFIPVLCLNAVGVWGRHEQQVTRELEESRQLADAVSTALVNHVESVWDMELTVGSALTLPGHPLPPEDMEILMRTVLADLPMLSVITWLGPDGITVASTRDGRRGTDVSDRDYFLRIKAGEEKLISDVMVGRVTEQPTVAIARGIRRDGQLLGVLVAGLDLSRFATLLPKVSAPGHQTGFLDRTGTVVYRNDQLRLELGDRQLPLGRPEREALAGRTVATRMYEDPQDGIWYMGVSQPIWPLGWVYFSRVPRAQVLAPGWTQTVRELSLLLLTATVSLAMALYMGRAFLRPIEALQRAARAILGGDLSARAQLAGPEELAAAVQTFDSMAASMQLADEVLRSRVSAVAHISQQALAGAAPGEIYNTAAAVVALSLGVEAALVLELYPATQSCSIVAGAGLGDELVGRTVRSSYQAVAKAVLDQEVPATVADVSALMGGDVRLGGAKVRSCALAPLAGSEDARGVLIACAMQPKCFSESDLHFMQAVANVLATAVHRQRAEADQAFLLRASNALAPSLDVDTVLSAAADLATESLADWCVLDIDLDGRFRRVVSAPTADAALRAAVARRVTNGRAMWARLQERLVAGEVLLRQCVSEADLQAIAGSDAEMLTLLRSMRMVASAVIPLIARGQVLGMMSLMTAKPTGFDRRTLDLARELAQRAALAADHAQVYARATALLQERNRALAMAERERQHLQAIFAQAPALILITQGPQHEVVLANPRFIEASGNRLALGRPLAESLPEIVEQGYLRLLDQVYATGVAHSASEAMLRTQRPGAEVAEELFFDFVYQPVHDLEGEPEGILVYAADVTEQVQARRQVEALAADLRLLAREQSAVAALGQLVISGAGLDTVLAEAVRLVLQVLGVDACRILQLQPDGRHLRVRAGTDWTGDDLVPLETRPGVPTLSGYTIRTRGPVVFDDLSAETRFSAWPTLMEVGVSSGASVVIAGDDDEPIGTLSIHSLNHRQFTADDVNFLISVAHVISQAMQHQRDQERLNTQHAVARILAEGEEQEAVLQRLLQALCEGLGWQMGLFWRVDEAAGVARCADTWRVPGLPVQPFLDVMGVTLTCGQGLVGTVWKEAKAIWAVDVTAEPIFVRTSLATAVGVHGALLMPVMYGERVLGVIACFSQQVRQPDPAVIRMATTIGRQVGQFLRRQQVEADLRELNSRLEERVTARTEELRRVNQELEAFAYSVSHDLRAPLRTIDGFSQALAEDFEELVGDDGRDFIRRIRGATKHMAGLIDDILRLSRVMRQELRFERVDVTALAQSVAADLFRERPDQQMDCTIAPGLAVRGDEKLLRQAFYNLLANAWKFTSRRPHPRVEVGCELQDGVPVYFVRDNGAGFDMRYRDKLFVPFQRLHPTAEFEGTGIGLATVQRIIQRHGGRIWAESAVDQGAAFYFTLQGGQPDEPNVDSTGRGRSRS